VTTFRLSYLHTPSDLDGFNSSDPGTVPAVLHRLILRRALFLATNEDLLNILDRVSPSVDEHKVYANEQAVLSEESHLHTLLGSRVGNDLEAYHASLNSGMLLRRSLGLKAGDAALIINGRVRSSCSKFVLRLLDIQFPACRAFWRGWIHSPGFRNPILVRASEASSFCH
jgi:hypothetical protein